MAIQSFGTNTAHDTAAAIAKLQAEGASAFILDLRGNSGGLVNAGKFLIWVPQTIHRASVNPAPVKLGGLVFRAPMQKFENVISGPVSAWEVLSHRSLRKKKSAGRLIEGRRELVYVNH